MNTIAESELDIIRGGESALTVWGTQAASDGLRWASNGGGNLFVMAAGTALAAAGGWAWAFGSAWDGLVSLY